LKYLPLFALFICSICSAQGIDGLSHIGPFNVTDAVRLHPEAEQLQGFEYSVPELVLGGEWTSIIKLTNRGTKPIPTTNVGFFDDAGRPLQATFQSVVNSVPGPIVSSTGFSFSLGIGGMLDLTFTADTPAAFGHGFVFCSAVSCGTPGLYGEVILRNHAVGRPDFESVFHFERPVPLQYMLFDGRNGLSTLVYVVNENTTATAVTMEVRDTSNVLLRTVNATLGTLSTVLRTLSDIAPETIGIEGTLVFRAQNATDGIGLITATGLRINPTNSFTPLRSFVPAP
jgi:hypothetical protein